MDDIIRQLHLNVLVVQALEQHPTHQIRVLSKQYALVPILTHDTRPWLGFQRYLSDDSRHRVVEAIRTTLLILTDILEMCGEVSSVVALKQQLLSIDLCIGLNAIRKRYEHDVSVSLDIDHLICLWRRIRGEGSIY